MKPAITFLACLIGIQIFACSNQSKKEIRTADNELNTDSMKLRITIGKNTFTATLYNTATVSAFKKKLPITVQMEELNGNEKFVELPDNLPANASGPGTIQPGDLMLYGSNTLVLFYKFFSTPYSYTPMGRIDNTSGLTTSLGSGNVSVTFDLQ